MTSSNVASLLVQPAAGDLIPKQELQPEVKGTGDLFAKTLQNVSGLTQAKDTTPTPKAPEKSGDTPKVELDKTSSKKEIKKEELKEPDMAETIEKVEAVVDEVKEVIKEELDITDEELELAMENLGLITIDLLDPQNLAKLVTELTGEEDSISLVMSEEFANILEDVTDLTNKLLKDIDNTLPEIKEFLVQIKPEGEIAVTDFQMPEKAIDVEQNVTPIQTDIPEEEVIVEKVESTVDTVKSELNVPVKTTEEKTTVQVTEDETQVVEEEGVPTLKVKTETQDNDSENNEFNPEQKQEKTVFKPHESETRTPVIRHENVNPMVQANNEIQFSVQEQVVELPTGETVKASDIANQFIEQAKIFTTTESTTMELTLNPEGLGKIFLEVTQKGNEITAKIFTENDAVKQALESQMANLKTEFNQSSTKVTSIEVSVGTHEFERNLDENGREDSRREEGQQQSSKRRGRIVMTSLDDLSGLMSDEEMLIAQMMKDNGGTLDFMA